MQRLRYQAARSRGAALFTSRRPDCRRAFVTFLLCFLGLISMRPAQAHPLAYSKFEASTNGRDIVIVFGLDTVAVTELIYRDIAHAKVEKADIEKYLTPFSAYFFERFSVSNNDAACTHAAEL